MTNSKRRDGERKACYLKNLNSFTSLLIMQWDTMLTAKLRSEEERWILEVESDSVKLLKLNQ